MKRLDCRTKAMPETRQSNTAKNLNESGPRQTNHPGESLQVISEPRHWRREFELKSLSLQPSGKVFFFDCLVNEGEDTGHA